LCVRNDVFVFVLVLDKYTLLELPEKSVTWMWTGDGHPVMPSIRSNQLK